MAWQFVTYYAGCQMTALEQLFKLAGGPDATDDDVRDVARGDPQLWRRVLVELAEGIRKVERAEERELAVLKSRVAAGDPEARIRLDALANEEIRKAIRNPQVATSGATAGFRR